MSWVKFGQQGSAHELDCAATMRDHSMLMAREVVLCDSAGKCHEDALPWMQRDGGDDAQADR